MKYKYKYYTFDTDLQETCEFASEKDFKSLMKELENKNIQPLSVVAFDFKPNFSYIQFWTP